MRQANGVDAATSYNITSMINPPPKPKQANGVVLGGALVTLFLGIAMSGWQAFVLYKLYSWFMVPIGAPELTWAAAWGIWMILSLLLSPLWPNHAGPSKALFRGALVTGVFTVYLGIGFLLVLGGI